MTFRQRTAPEIDRNSDLSRADGFSQKCTLRPSPAAARVSFGPRGRAIYHGFSTRQRSVSDQHFACTGAGRSCRKSRRAIFSDGGDASTPPEVISPPRGQGARTSRCVCAATPPGASEDARFAPICPFLSRYYVPIREKTVPARSPQRFPRDPLSTSPSEKGVSAHARRARANRAFISGTPRAKLPRHCLWVPA